MKNNATTESRRITAGFVKPKKSGWSRDFRKNYPVYILFIPVFAYFDLFSYWPMAGVSMAFQDYDIVKGMFGSPGAGFKHFANFFSDPYFGRLIGNTVIFSLLSIVFVFPMPIILALLLTAVHNKLFRRTIQTSVYMPFFIATVVVCGLIKNFVSNDGFIGMFFAKLGVVEDGTHLLTLPKFFRPIIVVSDIWQGVGFGSIIFVAALSSIDQTLYEAAAIDGAGRISKLFKITLPSILPMIMLMLTLRVGSLLSVGYEKIALLYGPETFPVADVLGSYVYRLGVAAGNEYSYTTAIGLFNSVVSLVLLLIANYLSKKTTSYGII